jgi:hypothetical protein
MGEIYLSLKFQLLSLGYGGGGGVCKLKIVLSHTHTSGLAIPRICNNELKNYIYQRQGGLT